MFCPAKGRCQEAFMLLWVVLGLLLGSFHARAADPSGTSELPPVIMYFPQGPILQEGAMLIPRLHFFHRIDRQIYVEEELTHLASTIAAAGTVSVKRTTGPYLLPLDTDELQLPAFSRRSFRSSPFERETELLRGTWHCKAKILSAHQEVLAETVTYVVVEGLAPQDARIQTFNITGADAQVREDTVDVLLRGSLPLGGARFAMEEAIQDGRIRQFLFVPKMGVFPVVGIDSLVGTDSVRVGSATIPKVEGWHTLVAVWYLPPAYPQLSSRDWVFSFSLPMAIYIPQQPHTFP